LRLRTSAFATFSFGGYGLAVAALALVVFGAYDSYPTLAVMIIGAYGYRRVRR